MAADALAITRRLARREDATADELFDYATSFLTVVPEDLQEPGTAVAYAKRVVTKSGGRDGTNLDLLARAYYRNSEVGRAIETEEKALSLLPTGNATSTSERRKMAAQLAKFKASLAHR